MIGIGIAIGTATRAVVGIAIAIGAATAVGTAVEIAIAIEIAIGPAVGSNWVHRFGRLALHWRNLADC
ncbi:hypothetical protein [Paenibacillus sp. FSL L8-0333]|uniref:hypothetical protein n=1 Tax=unclassified Paenibacillus TaxID=185978 RepID=UPI0030CF8463